MSTDLITEFPLKTGAVSANWPFGEPQDVSDPLLFDGTPWIEQTIKDLWGNLAGVLNAMDVDPNNTPDTALTNQYLSALVSFISSASFYEATGTVNAIVLNAVDFAGGGAGQRFNPAAVVDGQKFRFIATGDNTTAVTVNPAGDGANAAVFKGSALVGGEIISGNLIELTWDEGNTRYEITNLLRLQDLGNVEDSAYADGESPIWEAASSLFKPGTLTGLSAVSQASNGFGTISGPGGADVTVQWGSIAVAADTTTSTVTLPLAFTSSSSYGVSTVYNSSGTGEQDNWAINTKLAASFRITNGQNQALTFYWVAIGF